MFFLLLPEMLGKLEYGPLTGRDQTDLTKLIINALKSSPHKVYISLSTSSSECLQIIERRIGLSDESGLSDHVGWVCDDIMKL